MQREKIYTILTYILIPCSFLILFFAFFALLMTLSAPQMIIIAFLLFCVVIYTFKSSKFFLHNVRKEQPAKEADKAWIRINGFITLFFSLQLLLSGITALSDPKNIAKSIEMLQASIPSDQLAQMPGTAVWAQAIKGMSVVFIIYGVLQSLHVLMGLPILRKYSYLFSE